MDRAVATLEAAVVGGDAPLARRQLGELRDDADHEAALDVLARAAAQGSPLGMVMLVEAVDRFGAARRAVRRFLVDDAAVDDVTQDTLITVARAIGSFPGDGRFTAWLHQIARDRSADHLRRARATDRLGDPGHDPDADPEPGTDAARLHALVASRHAVQHLLAELPERYRDAVTLHDVEHLPYPEAATRLGRSVPTVRSHVARGRALLAALLVARGLEISDP